MQRIFLLPVKQQAVPLTSLSQLVKIKEKMWLQTMATQGKILVNQMRAWVRVF